jgi:hypothetical protein
MLKPPGGMSTGSDRFHFFVLGGLLITGNATELVGLKNRRVRGCLLHNLSTSQDQ